MLPNILSVLRDKRIISTLKICARISFLCGNYLFCVLVKEIANIKLIQQRKFIFSMFTEDLIYRYFVQRNHLLCCEKQNYSVRLQRKNCTVSHVMVVIVRHKDHILTLFNGTEASKLWKEYISMKAYLLNYCVALFQLQRQIILLNEDKTEIKQVTQYTNLT